MKKRGQRKISFIVVWLLLIFAFKAGAQSKGRPGQSSVPAGLEWKPAKPWMGLVQNLGPQALFPFGQLESAPPFFKSIFVPQKMPGAAYYLQHIGFFCRREWELEKSAHMPLRFRLGSLEYCNYLEGKNPGYNPGQ